MPLGCRAGMPHTPGQCAKEKWTVVPACAGCGMREDDLTASYPGGSAQRRSGLKLVVSACAGCGMREDGIAFGITLGMINGTAQVRANQDQEVK